jgi:hypothetical protein
MDSVLVADRLIVETAVLPDRIVGTADRRCLGVLDRSLNVGRRRDIKGEETGDDAIAWRSLHRCRLPGITSERQEHDHQRENE